MRVKLIFLMVLGITAFFAPGYAQDIEIVYTGDTHAMLYTCSCPIEQDGGLARRATILRELRSKNPNLLLLDSGSFFAGGVMDEYTQNTELDKERTLVNLKALALMRYDALALSDDEFNFGSEFLQEAINKTRLNFLSCNAGMDKVLPYIVKEVSGVKIGVIGVTTMQVKSKAVGIELAEPVPAVKKSIAELKKRGASIIILLSRLRPDDNTALINTDPGIDVLIGSSSQNKKSLSDDMVGSTLVLNPGWQGRKLFKLTLTLQDKKIVKTQVEDIRLSSDISDDKSIQSILPRCFSMNDCKKDSLVGSCQNPGKLSAACTFVEPSKVSLLVITSKDCLTCAPERIVEGFKKVFPGIKPAYVWYPEARAKELVNKLGIHGLPVYLFGKELEQDSAFEKFKENVEERGGYYMMKAQRSGISYFLDRPVEASKLDLFVSLHDKDTAELLKVIRELKPAVHFLAVEKDKSFESKNGLAETEDCLRAVCVQKYYPKNFWDYISCRAANPSSSWWDNCLPGLDLAKIRSCAQGSEGIELLKTNTRLNKDLGIMFGPTYLSNNQEIFGSNGVPSKEDLKKVLKKQAAK